MTVEVTQADREAAADFICWQRAATQSAIEGQHDVRQFFVAGFSKAIRQGIWDEHQVVQAFAAHRTTALEGVAGLVEALEPFARLAGPINGEDGRPTYLEAISGPNGTDELLLTTYVGDGLRKEVVDAEDYRRAAAALATFRDQGGR